METIEDIISEMRRNGVVHDPRHFNELCDRIESALKRKDEATHSQWERAMVLEAENKNLRAECESWRKQALEENGALDVARAENEKLRAALKPVMEYPIDRCNWWSENLMYQIALSTIKKVQRIYNESEAKK